MNVINIWGSEVAITVLLLFLSIKHEHSNVFDHSTAFGTLVHIFRFIDINFLIQGRISSVNFEHVNLALYVTYKN